MDADTGAHPLGDPASEGDGVPRRLQIAPYPDDDEADDSHRAGAGHHRVGTLREVPRTQVAMRVDQRQIHGQAGYTRTRMAGLEYLVFSQSSVTTVDVGAWGAQAARFFGTRLEASSWDDRLVMIPRDGGRSERRLLARARTDDDLIAADAAEARAGGGGLALLARRCPTVWQVVRESDPDPVALRLAAILASILLGPIVDPSVPEIFGVKTARERLERLSTPDR